MIAKTDQALASLDISELIRETIALVRGDLEAAGIVVQLELAAQLPLISAHKGRLQQVILNLVTNAADAMRAVTDRGRVLTVKCGLEADSIAVWVQDSGTGIDQNNIEQIFKPFLHHEDQRHGNRLGDLPDYHPSSWRKIIGITSRTCTVLCFALSCRPSMSLSIDRSIFACRAKFPNNILKHFDMGQRRLSAKSYDYACFNKNSSTWEKRA